MERLRRSRRPCGFRVEPRKRGPRKAYRARSLLSPASLDAYRRLIAALPRAILCPEVQLARFVSADHLRDRRWHYRIAQLSVDFAICDAEGNVRAVVEIDDKTHSRRTQRLRDKKKDDACRAAGIPVIRWQARALPDPNAMAAQVRAVAFTSRDDQYRETRHPGIIASITSYRARTPD